MDGSVGRARQNQDPRRSVELTVDRRLGVEETEGALALPTLSPCLHDAAVGARESRVRLLAVIQRDVRVNGALPERRGACLERGLGTDRERVCADFVEKLNRG